VNSVGELANEQVVAALLDRAWIEYQSPIADPVEGVELGPTEGGLLRGGPAVGGGVPARRSWSGDNAGARQASATERERRWRRAAVMESHQAVLDRRISDGYCAQRGHLGAYYPRVVCVHAEDVGGPGAHHFQPVGGAVYRRECGARNGGGHARHLLHQEDGAAGDNLAEDEVVGVRVMDHHARLGAGGPNDPYPGRAVAPLRVSAYQQGAAGCGRRPQVASDGPHADGLCPPGQRPQGLRADGVPVVDHRGGRVEVVAVEAGGRRGRVPEAPVSVGAQTLQHRGVGVVRRAIDRPWVSVCTQVGRRGPRIVEAPVADWRVGENDVLVAGDARHQATSSR
jgi:hypothetical protein